MENPRESRVCPRFLWMESEINCLADHHSKLWSSQGRATRPEVWFPSLPSFLHRHGALSDLLVHCARHDPRDLMMVCEGWTGRGPFSDWSICKHNSLVVVERMELWCDCVIGGLQRTDV